MEFHELVDFCDSFVQVFFRLNPQSIPSYVSRQAIRFFRILMALIIVAKIVDSKQKVSSYEAIVFQVWYTEIILQIVYKLDN